MNVGSLEVVDMLLPISDLLHDTDASKTMMSNVDETVLSEDKSDTKAIDLTMRQKEWLKTRMQYAIQSTFRMLSFSVRY